MDADSVARAARVAALGHERPLSHADLGAARAATADAEPAVRAAAVAAEGGVVAV